VRRRSRSIFSHRHAKHTQRKQWNANIDVKSPLLRRPDDGVLGLSANLSIFQFLRWQSFRVYRTVCRTTPLKKHAHLGYLSTRCSRLRVMNASFVGCLMGKTQMGRKYCPNLTNGGGDSVRQKRRRALLLVGFPKRVKPTRKSTHRYTSAGRFRCTISLFGNDRSCRGGRGKCVR